MAKHCVKYKFDKVSTVHTVVCFVICLWCRSYYNYYK